MQRQVSLSRRNLLRGLPVSDERPLRPPGAIGEVEFTDRCTACDDCVAACPQGIVFRGSGGYPEMNFLKAECTFCGACIDSCREGALQTAARPPWRLRLELQDSCLARRQIVCQTCGDVCEADAVRFTPRLRSVAVPQIDPDICTGCGACVAACPACALKVHARD